MRWLALALVALCTAGPSDDGRARTPTLQAKTGGAQSPQRVVRRHSRQGSISCVILPGQPGRITSTVHIVPHNSPCDSSSASPERNMDGGPARPTEKSLSLPIVDE